MGEAHGMSDTGQPSADVDQLYRECREALTAFFVRRHLSAHTAEDLVHETFFRLMRQVDRCRAAGSPRGYLFGIARHVSADAWRRTRPGDEGDAEAETIAAPQPDPRLAAAHEIIAALPALQREVLDLRFQHDLSYAEIAEALGVPVGTVRSRLHNALELLRERLEQDGTCSTGETSR
jgi:RNA polymerase sigma-70 factor, ECF subfamily